MIYNEIVSAMGLPFTIIYGLLLLGFIYFIFVSIPRSYKTKFWPTAVGKVTHSELRERKGKSKGRSTILYSAKIEYTYKVSGKEYSSKKIKWLDHTSNNKRHHERIVDKYFLGKEVSVFYNPQKPTKAILEPGFSTGNFVALLFFIISLGTMTFELSTKL